MRRCYSCFNVFDDQFDVCPFCGMVFDDSPSEVIYLSPGTVLNNRYIIGHAIGAGGFGIIYKAWDQKLETAVAVKEFFSSHIMTRSPKQRNITVFENHKEEFKYRKARFLSEARIMAKFGSHRSIVNVYEFFEENDTAYFVMELLTGMTMREYLDSHGGKTNVPFAIMVTNEVCQALKSIHESGIVHRDIAPDNIFICSGKEIRVKLLDFGAARLANNTDDVIDVILKPGYSPVEQYDKTSKIGPYTDIYALGATFYQMITGIKPEESTNRKLEDDLVAPRQLVPSISENLNNAIIKALAVDSHMRFKSAEEFYKAINGDRRVDTLAKERIKKRVVRASGIFVAAALITVVSIIIGDTINEKRKVQYLSPAEINVWISVEEGSNEENAVKKVLSDFHEQYPDVAVNLSVFNSSDYNSKISEAAENGSLPDIFESSGLPDEVLTSARDVTPVLESDQASECDFIKGYYKYYTDRKKIPLGIDIPTACIITNGPVKAEFTEEYFSDPENICDKQLIALDGKCPVEVLKNYQGSDWAQEETFLGNEKSSAVFLSSTMRISDIKRATTGVVKSFVYPNTDKVYCKYIYEWSLGNINGTESQNKASERLLSWMLGNKYQNSLMISWCSDGQFPINSECFLSKIETDVNSFGPLKKIKNNFVFER